ncbi:MAG: hypothetical protein ABIR06_08185, partial [Cyclobacteriaceae bacterium]
SVSCLRDAATPKLSSFKTNNFLVMSVRRTIPEDDGIYFITFTCWKWLQVIELSNGYDAIYKWFDVLKNQGHYIAGYVIMPNHIHALLAFTSHAESQRLETLRRRG